MADRERYPIHIPDSGVGTFVFDGGGLMEAEEEQVILAEANKLFGERFQVDLCIEECSELIKALLKHRRYNTTKTLLDMAEELADVSIMVQQLITVFRVEPIVTNVRHSKLYRQRARNHTAQDEHIEKGGQK